MLEFYLLFNYIFLILIIKKNLIKHFAEVQLWNKNLN